MSLTRMLRRGRGPARARRVLLAGLAGGAIAATCIVVFAAVTGAEADAIPALAPSRGPGAADEQSGGWIAYSTAPANWQRARRGGDEQMPYLQGSDVYLARAGGEPRRVAGRGVGTTWNVCPAFSPDGTMLAFGARSRKRRAIRVVGVTRDGAVVAPRIRLPVDGGGDAPCPRWSADGSRLAYLKGGQVVVRELDGSLGRRRAGDPTVGDFRRNVSMLVSPAGDRVARDVGCDVEVTRLDGTEPRDLNVGVGCFYALAGWSPKGRELLLMVDISGFHFTMYAVPVDRAGEAVPVAVAVRVNHPRSWPRYGDVSWQPSESP